MNRGGMVAVIGPMAGLCLLFCACSSDHYARRADRDVYRILEDVGVEEAGQEGPFTIDTPYTGRKAEEIDALEIIGDRQATNTMVLDLEQTLRLAVRNSREYQREKENLYLTALNLTGEQFRWRPRFQSATSTASTTRSPDGTRSGRVDSRLSVGQLLLSGASIGATLANDLFRFYTGDPGRTATSVLSANIAQPLLRGAGRTVAGEQLKQAERDLIYAIRAFSHFQRRFSVEIVSDYFDLLQLQDTVRNRFTDYRSRTNTTARLQSRFEAGIETTVGVGQAQQAELSARNSYVNTVGSYFIRLNNFKLRLGIPVSYDLRLDSGELERLNRKGLIAVPVSLVEGFRIAITNNLEMLNAVDRYEDSRRQVRIAADRLRPGLDLFANASLESEGPTDYTEFDPDRVRTTFGIDLDLPVNRINERNQFRATRIRFEQAIRDLALALDSRRNDIEDGIEGMYTFGENYRIQGLAVALAEERVASADLNIQAGRATVRDLVEAQDELLGARNAYSAALVDYLVARLYFLLDMGILDTEIERYWLSEKASTLDLDPDAGADREVVVPPDVLFGTRP